MRILVNNALFAFENLVEYFVLVAWHWLLFFHLQDNCLIIFMKTDGGPNMLAMKGQFGPNILVILVQKGTKFACNFSYQSHLICIQSRFWKALNTMLAIQNPKRTINACNVENGRRVTWLWFLNVPLEIIASIYSPFRNNDCKHIESLTLSRLQGYLVSFEIMIASIFGLHDKNHRNHKWFSPIQSLDKLTLFLRWSSHVLESLPQLPRSPIDML